VTGEVPDALIAALTKCGYTPRDGRCMCAGCGVVAAFDIATLSCSRATCAGEPEVVRQTIRHDFEIPPSIFFRR
jgi:hypothetical protein